MHQLKWQNQIFFQSIDFKVLFFIIWLNFVVFTRNKFYLFDQWPFKFNLKSIELPVGQRIIQKMVQGTFFQDYSKVSTIGGLVHVFRSDLAIWKRLFWIIVMLAMLFVGIYWSVYVLLHWKSNPVLVTVESVGENFVLLMSFHGVFLKRWDLFRFTNKWSEISNYYHLSRGPF